MQRVYLKTHGKTQENCNFFASGSSQFYYIFGLEVKQENEKEEEITGTVQSIGIKLFFRLCNQYIINVTNGTILPCGVINIKIGLQLYSDPDLMQELEREHLCYHDLMSM